MDSEELVTSKDLDSVVDSVFVGFEDRDSVISLVKDVGRLVRVLVLVLLVDSVIDSVFNSEFDSVFDLVFDSMPEKVLEVVGSFLDSEELVDSKDLDSVVILADSLLDSVFVGSEDCDSLISLDDVDRFVRVLLLVLLVDSVFDSVIDSVFVGSEDLGSVAVLVSDVC